MFCETYVSCLLQLYAGAAATQVGAVFSSHDADESGLSDSKVEFGHSLLTRPM